MEIPAYKSCHASSSSAQIQSLRNEDSLSKAGSMFAFTRFLLTDRGCYAKLWTNHVTIITQNSLGMKWVKKYSLDKISLYSGIIIAVIFDMSLL